jgi:glycosyltransferase involved in cell wall biosynthesis
LQLELELVEGVPHEEARRIYARADVAVDQLHAGWYGGFAVVAMALGLPVVAYLRDGDLGVLPAGMREEIPVIHATSETLADVLRERLTTDREGLRELGRRSRAFVERWHDPRAIASALAADYESVVQRRSR